MVVLWILAVVVAGGAVLALVLGLMGRSTVTTSDGGSDEGFDSAVPGVATGHHRTTETGSVA